MALTSLYIKKDLSASERSRLLNNSGLARSDCELLRTLSQETTLSLSELNNTGASSSVVASSSVLGGNASNQGEASAGGEVALNGGEASLPCLRLNNSNGGACEDKTEVVSAASVPIPSWVRKAEFKVKTEVMALFQKYPLENIGFLTLTFADDVQCHKQATKRLNSLITGVLREHYAKCIRVSERQKKGRWHFHLVVVCQQDIRRGFNHANYDLNNKRLKECNYDRELFAKRYGKKLPDGHNKALGNQWAFWVATAKKYGFGRPELLPIRKNGEALAAYVAKYISKGFAYRQPQDKGARLYSVIGGDRVCSSRFSFYSPMSCLWRQKVAMWAASWSGAFDAVAISGGHTPTEHLTYDDLPNFFGKKWAWKFREQILATPLDCPF